MKEYYDILGISSNSSLEEIKRAYRRQAKKYHPDINKSPEAGQLFIEITEAYKILVGMRTQGLSRHLRTSLNKKQAKEDFLSKQKAMARKRAREYANMKYEEFIRSESYQISEAFSVILYHLFFLICLCLVFLMPPMLYIYYGESGVFVSIVMLLIISPFLITVFRDYRDLSYKNLKEAFHFLLKGYMLAYVVLVLLNVILLFWIGFQTLIPTSYLLLSYSFAGLVTFLFFKKKTPATKKGEKYYRAICLAPLSINLFLLLNYMFSSGQYFETYSFVKGHQNVYNKYSEAGTQNTTLITLENNHYEPYWGIRIFGSIDKVNSGSIIQYKFEKGLFGITVMKDYGIR